MTSPAAAPTFALSRHLTAADRAQTLAADVRAGLRAHPKTLPPKWFYDAEGGRLFDELTRAPEYYQTRTERGILAERVGEIARLSRAETVVELGSGTSEKTRLLLSALAATGSLRRFVPFDVDEETLHAAGAAIAGNYPGVAVHAVVGDFEQHLALLPRAGRRLIVFLGGTIGNLHPAGRRRFLRALRATLHAGDTLLLGTDLVKDPARILPAYDDAAGIGVRFNRNMLAVLNAALGGDFRLTDFDHVARWNPVEEWVEVLLRSRVDQIVTLRAIDLEVSFAAGEELHTEISAKFRPEGVRTELLAADLEPIGWWTDAAGDFGMSLSAPTRARPTAAGGRRPGS